jgi:hypothetical protein
MEAAGEIRPPDTVLGRDGKSYQRKAKPLPYGAPKKDANPEVTKVAVDAGG